jgi:hypothetical protein
MASGDDWFDPSFVTYADQVAATQVAPLAKDPNLIGFYTDSELHWGPDGSDFNPVLDNYLALPEGSPGRAVADQYVGNPNGFVTALATRYFQVTTAAVRMYDTHHLILGVKAEAQEIQPELLEAAQPYVDVFSIDDYTLRPGFAQAIDTIWPQYLPVTSTFDNFEQYVKRPIMVGEYSFIASGPATPDTVPGVYDVYPSQAERATALSGYLSSLELHAPWVVGDEWFEYVDEPAGGRFDGENDNFGMVNVEDQPYPEMVDAMERLHSIAPDRVATTGPTCDSWGTSSGTTVCTATMDQPSYPLTFATDPPPAGVVGKAYDASLVAVGGRPPYAFALTAGAVPKGLHLDGRTGELSGTPTRSGTSNFTVQVSGSDQSGPATLAVTITITPSVPVTITTASLGSAKVGVAYDKSLVAKNGTAPYTWAVTAGTLPAGLSLGSDGQLTGTPAAAGSNSLTVTVTDATTPAGTASHTYTLPVR